MADLRIGTCSWKYDSWKGIIYPELEKINYLQEYAKKFNTVEIDQWFWSLGEKSIRLPIPNVVKAYKLSVPEEFRFSVKLPNSLTLTHYYKKNKEESLKPNPHFLSSELLNQFLYSISEIKENLGPLMFQFEYLNKQKVASQALFQNGLKNFFEITKSEFTFAIETRNPNYLNKHFFEFINEYDLAFVFLEGYYMPPIWEVYNKFKDYMKNTVVIRLHGPDRKGIEKKSGGKWNKIIEPKDDDIIKIISIIKEMLLNEVDVYLNVNNHYEGSAPLTIEKLNHYLAIGR
jgi:uncharacterized protein YecE (DUF72 family)